MLCGNLNKQDQSMAQGRNNKKAGNDAEASTPHSEAKTPKALKSGPKIVKKSPNQNLGRSKESKASVEIKGKPDKTNNENRKRRMSLTRRMEVLRQRTKEIETTKRNFMG